MNMIEDVQPAVGVPTSCLVIIYIYIILYLFIWCISADKYLLARLRHILFEFFEDDVAFALSVGQLSDLVGWLSLLL